jgi:hypothetical protein
VVVVADPNFAPKIPWFSARIWPSRLETCYSGEYDGGQIRIPFKETALDEQNGVITNTNVALNSGWNTDQLSGRRRDISRLLDGGKDWLAMNTVSMQKQLETRALLEHSWLGK